MSFQMAVAMKRRNKKAKGGAVSPHADKKMAEKETKSIPMLANGGEASKTMSLSDKMDKILAEHDHDEVMEHMAGRMGKAEPTEMPFEGGMDEDYPDISDAIMRKRYAEGGQVDLASNAEESSNTEDDLSFEALKKENYSESAGLDDLDQPLDSNEKGDELSDADSHDMADVIRRKMKMKDPGKPFGYR